MNARSRRDEIIKILAGSKDAVSGINLAKQLEVSRQVIVQDIAILRAAGHDIISTNQGYLINEKQKADRVFKVIHTPEQVAEELELIVDLGGQIKDVFVYHKVYGVIRADMNIKSRLDVRRFMDDITNGKSSLLSNVTSGYHYHTVTADNEMILDMIQKYLQDRGFLAKLQDYEPVNFWEEK